MSKVILVKTKNVSVKVIADTINAYGNRITSLECDYPRMVHPHVMTHGLLKKNAQSSRAVRTWMWIKQLYKERIYPHYNREQRGMTGGKDITGVRLFFIKLIVELEMAFLVLTTLAKQALGLHKQYANRPLEPYQKIRVVITATEWDNFFKLRLHKDAQPEVQELAGAIKEALELSTPESHTIHLPYKNENIELFSKLTTVEQVIYSIAKCAQVSYRKDTLTIEGAKRIYIKLAGSLPKHESPLAHIAFIGESVEGYIGWRQLRHSYDVIEDINQYLGIVIEEESNNV